MNELLRKAIIYSIFSLPVFGAMKLCYEGQQAMQKIEAERSENEFILRIQKFPDGTYFSGFRDFQRPRHQQLIEENYYNLNDDTTTIEQYVQSRFNEETDRFETVENKLVEG